MIIQYEGNVFTHGGQTTVKDFGDEVKAASEDLKKVPKPLNVYFGYHGTKPDGEWFKDFDIDEMNMARGIAQMFANVTPKEVTKRGMTDKEITDAVENGKVFFTWCDSNNRVKKAMKTAAKKMPNLISITSVGTK